MGNTCTSYCISDGTGPDVKRKITMEQKEGEGQNVAYINEQRQEFEIEYNNGTPGAGQQQQFGSSGITKGGHFRDGVEQNYGGDGYKEGYEPNDKINMGP